MSGVEAAGLLLAIIPLIIEAFDHCERTYDAFATYRKYPREIMKIDSKLGAQRTVFRNNCINLLAKLSGDREKIQDMLSKPSHPMWRDGTLNEMFLHHLQSLDQTFHSCKRTMEQIYEALQEISSETEGFRVLVNDTRPGETAGTREWCRRIGVKIKLSLHKPRIEERIEELRTFNADFSLMANQILESLRTMEAKPPVPMSRSGSDLAKYRNIREASQNLYDTLVSKWSCSTHTKHSAHICFGPEAADVHSNSSTALVRLKMAVTYLRQDVIPEPIWLSVESTTEDVRKRPDVHSTQALAQFTQLLQVRANEALTGTAKASSEKLLDGRGLIIPSPMSGAQSDASSVIDDEVPDLCNVQDLCNHFKHEQRAPDPVCLGFFKGRCTQRFYHSTAIDCPSGSSSSLSEVISWIDGNSLIRSLPRHIIIALAASMSAAVLQYHSTSWLSESWQSNEIWLFGVEGFQQGTGSLMSPHLNVDISRTQENISTLTAPKGETTSKGARNELLFRLGIILLELGFAKPWPLLREKVLLALPEGKVTDYHAAERLARLLVRNMGPRYSKITLKCLGCDFGLGESDLSSEELQQSFLVEVVDALQTLNHRFPGHGS